MNNKYLKLLKDSKINNLYLEADSIIKLSNNFYTHKSEGEWMNEWIKK
jgi:hypothetical protein